MRYLPQYSGRILLSAFAVLTLLAYGGSPYGTSPAEAATFVVTRTDDPDPPGACEPDDCSLREALIAANADTSEPHVIQLQDGAIYVLDIDGADEDAAATGDLDIAEDITIEVAGGGTATVRQTAVDRVFDVLSGGSLTLDGITVTGGSGVQDGGGILNVGTLTIIESTISANSAETGRGGGIFNGDGALLTLTDSTVGPGNTAGNEGGGIFNNGNLTLTRTTVAGNHADNDGGGINNRGSLQLVGSTVSGNTANEDGGGIYHSHAAGLRLDSSTIAGNTAQGGSGGGIYNNTGVVTVTRSTISGNTALENAQNGSGGDGGGIHNTNPLFLINSTVSGNSADFRGGGISNPFDTATLVNTTVTGNSAPSGAGINEGSATTLNLSNTIIALNNEGEDCLVNQTGNIVSQGNNLDSDGTCVTDGVNGDITCDPGDACVVGLSVLAGNGGPTQTHALLPGSPAIDAGNESVCQDEASGSAQADQRGLPRSEGAVCDIGAYEVQQPGLTVTKLCVGDGFQATFTLTVATITQPAACGDFVTAEDLAPGDHTVSESITGPDMTDFTTVIACEGAAPVEARSTTVNIPFDSTIDVTCVIINFFGDGDGAGDQPAALIVFLPVDIDLEIDNTNTNVIGVDNANSNDNQNGNANTNGNSNANSNENANDNENGQDQHNAQDQDNADQQTNNITSSPEVTIDFGD